MIDSSSSAIAKGSPYASPCLAVVKPVYNEATTVAEVVKTVLAQPLAQELIVVDDGFSDGTWEALQPAKSDSRVKLFSHEQNPGKGAVLRTAFAKVAAPLVLVQNADLE